jgi:monoterpene epsilon-lactone hydrolase
MRRRPVVAAATAPLIRTLLALVASRTLAPGTTWEERRGRSARMTRSARTLGGVLIRRGELGGQECEIATPEQSREDVVLLYLHGGGWTVGSPATHRSLVARLASRMQMPAWSIDYRLAPEHPFPAALDDCVSAYRALLDDGHQRIVVAGDSAGGGLTISLALAIRDLGLPAPVALGMLCPAVDLTEATIDGLVDTRREPLLSVRVLREMFGAYAAGQDRTNPLLSPRYADLSGLPPMVLDSAADDLLGEQDLAFAQRVRAAGGSLDHCHHEGVWHVFHALAGWWPVATQALDGFADRLVAATERRT